MEIGWRGRMVRDQHQVVEVGVHCSHSKIGHAPEAHAFLSAGAGGSAGREAAGAQQHAGSAAGCQVLRGQQAVQCQPAAGLRARPLYR